MRKPLEWVRLGVGIIIAVALLAWAGSKFDLARAQATLSTADPKWAALAILSLLVGYAIRTVRWRYMLARQGSSATYFDVLRVLMGATALNNVLPFRAGDVVRIVRYPQLLQVSPSTIVGTMLVERLLDLLALLAMFFIFANGLSLSGDAARYVSMAQALTAVGVTATVLLFLLSRPISARLEGMGESKFAKAALPAFSAIVQFSNGRSLGILAVLTMAAWLFECGMFIGIGTALGYGLNPLGPAFAMAVATLATLIPSTPGYLGTFDAAATVGLSAYGARQADAVIFALVSHVVQWATITVIGLALIPPRRKEIVADA